MTPVPDEDEAPPLPLRWGVLYAIVLATLLAVIGALWVLTETFR